MNKWYLAPAWLAFILFSSGCNPPVESLQPISTITNTPEPEPAAATATPLKSEENGSSTQLINPTHTPEAAEPESLTTRQTQPDTEHCGLFLPLISEPTNPPDAPLIVDPIAGILPADARPAFERLISSPESVALVAFEVGRESEGVYHNADLPMPLASVVKIINLIAYAEAVDNGLLDPAEWIPLDDINNTYLPGSDLGAHERALSELEERGLIGRDPPSVPLEELPWMMIRHSSNAASDYIHLSLGQDYIEMTAARLGLTRQTAPCPWIGQFLIMNNNERPSGNNRSVVQGLIANPSAYGQEVMRLTQAFRGDPDFRQNELSRRWRSDINTQKLFGHNLNAQGSAQEYADLMAQILQNGLSSSYVNIITRRALEWPSEFEANQEHFDLVGYKNGSLPGILTTLYYAQRQDDGAQIVVALFYRDLPMPLYREWRRNLSHDQFARWLLVEPNAINTLGTLLTGEH